MELKIYNIKCYLLWRITSEKRSTILWISEVATCRTRIFSWSNGTGNCGRWQNCCYICHCKGLFVESKLELLCFYHFQILWTLPSVASVASVTSGPSVTINWALAGNAKMTMMDKSNNNSFMLNWFDTFHT